MSTPTTFHAHGKEWFPHTPGNPMPCDGDSQIHVQIRSQTSALQLSAFVDYASSWCWAADENDRDGEIIGWCYANPPQEKDELKIPDHLAEKLKAHVGAPSELARLREENASMRTAIQSAIASFEYIQNHERDFTSPELFFWNALNQSRAALATLSPFTESK